MNFGSVHTSGQGLRVHENIPSVLITTRPVNHFDAVINNKSGNSNCRSMTTITKMITSVNKKQLHFFRHHYIGFTFPK